MDFHWLIGVFCVFTGAAGLVIAALGILRFSWRIPGRRIRSFLSEPYGVLVVLLIAGFIMLAPVTACKMFSAENDPVASATALDWFTSNLYATAQALVMQNDILDYLGAIFGSPAAGALSFFGGNLLIKVAFSFILFLYMVALPASLAFFAFDAVFNGLKEFILRRYLHRADTVYVFNGAGAAAESLTESIVSDWKTNDAMTGSSRNRPPLLIFCPGGPDGEDSIENIKDTARGYVRTHFTKVAFEDVPATAIQTFSVLKSRSPRNRLRSKSVPSIFFLAIQDDCTVNVNATIRSTDQVVHAIELYALDSVAGNTSKLLKKVGDDKFDISTELTAPIERLLACMNFTCLQDNPDDDLVFDTLWQRKSSDDVIQHAGGYAGDLTPNESEDLRTFNRLVRERMEVHLIAAARKEVYDALTEHPLYDVLQQVDLNRPMQIPHQLLVVLVAGLGDRGIQALLATYWAGRLPGVELRIIAVDRNASKAAEALAAAYHTVLEEQTPAGVPTVYPYGAGIGSAMAPNALDDASPDRMLPTVRFCEMDVRSSSFNMLLQGDAAPSFAFDPNGTLGGATHPAGTSHLFCSLPEEVLIPANARVYAFIALDDDGLNLNCALNVQRQLLNRIVDTADDAACHAQAAARPEPLDPPCPIIIAPRIRSSEIMESVSHLSGSDAATLTIHPFGSLQSTFTREKILDSRFERFAIQLCGAYNSAGNVSGTLAKGGTIDGTAPEYPATLRAYNSSEVEKLSNRCAARFLPYRLWTMGYSPDCIEKLITASGQKDSAACIALEHAWFKRLGMEILLDGPNGASNRTVMFRGKETDLFSVACLFVGAGKPDATHDQFLEDEADYRRIFPTACALGDIEHARWTASYGTFGWRPLQSERQEWAIADIEQHLSSNGRSAEPAKDPKRNSSVLKRHAYMTMPARDLLERGRRYGKDPYAYDRIINAYTMRILQGRVTKNTPRNGKNESKRG